MRSLQRRKQNIWFVHRERDDSRLEQIYVYDKPIKKYYSVSPTSGTPFESYYGVIPSYDRYIVCFEHDYIPKEGTLVYIDRVPEIDANGNLVIGEDLAPTVLPDYVVSKNARTKKGLTTRIGISKLSGDDEEPTNTTEPDGNDDGDENSSSGDEGDGGSLG